MKSLRSTLIAGAMLAASAMPSAAITNAEVLDAMNARIAEITQQISVLQGQLATASPAQQRFLLREVRSLNVRRGQLRSLSRIVPRYNERFLTRIVTFFNLDVSLA